jgi:hypothetical protein
VVLVRDEQPSIKLRLLIDGMIEAFGPIPLRDREIAHLLG